MVNFDEKLKENLNIPNLLSVIRILLIFPEVYYFINDKYIISAILLSISGITDMFGGYIARKYNKITKLGSMIDPVADKLTLIAIVFCIGSKFKIIMPLAIILFIKELIMLIAGVILLNKHKTPSPSKWYGKLATIVFYFSIIIIVALKAIWNIENVILTLTLMLITMILMLFALIKYFFVFIDILKNDEEIEKTPQV